MRNKRNAILIALGILGIAVAGLFLTMPAEYVVHENGFGGTPTVVSNGSETLIFIQTVSSLYSFDKKTIPFRIVMGFFYRNKDFIGIIKKDLVVIKVNNINNKAFVFEDCSVSKNVTPVNGFILSRDDSKNAFIWTGEKFEETGFVWDVNVASHLNGLDAKYLDKKLTVDWTELNQWKNSKGDSENYGFDRKHSVNIKRMALNFEKSSMTLEYAMISAKTTYSGSAVMYQEFNLLGGNTTTHLYQIKSKLTKPTKNEIADLKQRFGSNSISD